MSTVTTDRNVDLSALPFEARSRWDGTTCEVEADTDEQTLRDAVEAAPDAPEPVDRVAALEARLDAVAALAEKANATATEVAAAARPQR